MFIRSLIEITFLQIGEHQNHVASNGGRKVSRSKLRLRRLHVTEGRREGAQVSSRKGSRWSDLIFNFDDETNLKWDLYLEN